MSEHSRDAHTEIHPWVRSARRLHRVVLWLERYGATALLACAALTFVCAAFGVRTVPEYAGVPRVLYGAAQVLVFDWQEASESSWIAAAQCLAVLTATLGAVELARRCFDQVLQRQLIRWRYRDHVVLAGLDAGALVLADSLVAAGKAVVAIEPAGAAPVVGRARNLGIPVHVGDPADADELAATAAEHARWVVALSGDTRVAAALREVVRRSSPDLIALRDRAVGCLLAAAPRESLEPRPMWLARRWLSGEGVNVAQVDVEDRIASRLVAELGLFRHVLAPGGAQASAAEAPPPRRVLVLGEGRFAERVASVIVWDSALVYSPVAGAPAVAVTLVHPRAQEILDGLGKELRSRLTAVGPLPLVARTTARPLVTVLGDDDLCFESAAGGRASRFDLVVVDCGSNDRTLAAADPLARRFFQEPLAHHPVVVVVLEGEEERARSLDAYGFAPGALAERLARTGPAPAGRLVYVFDAWKRTLDAERLLGPSGDAPDVLTDAVERLARRAHWVHANRVARSKGESERSESEIILLWRDTSEEFRESSRQFVRDVERKLALLGCDLVHAPAGTPPSVAFTGREIECFARAEHERWMVERWERGWRLGTLGKIEELTSEHLRPWDSLAPGIQDIDREFIRELQRRILGPEGFGVVRWKALAPAAGDRGVPPPAAVGVPLEVH